MMISVCMITYNHGKFVGQAIQSVVDQKLDCSLELVIGEDASSDNTRAICEDYAKKYPGQVRLLPSETRYGMMGNFVRTLNECKGKYIAICEGDDYWSDPLKLKKQLDFMEANPDYAICFHRVYDLENGKTTLSDLNQSLKEETYTIQDLALKNFIHTPSVLFRNGLIKKFPAWINESPVGDYVAHMLNARHGKIKYLPEAMAVYRRNAGIWSSQSMLTTYEKWSRVLDFLLTEDFDPDVIEGLRRYRRSTISEYLKILFEKDQPLFLEKMARNAEEDPLLAKEWLLNYYPALVREAKKKPQNTFLKRIRNKTKSLIKSVLHI